MKIKITIMFLLLLRMSFVYAQQDDSKQMEKDTKYQELIEIIKTGEFIFEADKTFQKGGGMVDLTTNPNLLKITEGKAIADLPFFGETYQLFDMSGDAGINFDGEMIDYKETYDNEKMQVDIQFQVKTKNDKYSCYLRLLYNRNATLEVDCISKSHARYIGGIAPVNEN